MKENLVATGLAFALLLIAIAARKPTTEASPQHVEGLNQTALDDSAATVTTTATEPAAQQDAVSPPPALLEEPVPVAFEPGPLSAVSTTAECPTCAPAIRYVQPQYQQSYQRRGIPILRRLRGRR